MLIEVAPGEFIKPYLCRNMIRDRLHGKTGICAVIQAMYLQETNEDVKLKLRVAMRESKNLYNELVKYKNKYHD